MTDRRTGRSRAPSAAARAFTLVELLVVIAILGVLAGLLLPALSRSREKALEIRCRSNLRQLALATQMYTDDHEGALFRYRTGTLNGGDCYWFGWLERGAEGKRRFDASQGALFPYLGGRGVELCPSLRYHLPTFKLKAAGAAYGYGYNLHLSRPAAEPPLRTAGLPRLSDLAFFADAAQVNTFQAPASPENPLLEEFYYVNTTEATAHFRHRQRAAVAFGDGHVGTESSLENSRDLRLPSAWVARLRPAILLPDL